VDLGLDGRVAVVAAGSSGIGLGAATALAREGADVEICGRSPERLDRALSQIREVATGTAEGTVADVRDAAAVAGWIAGVVERHGRIDIVVANSAGTPAGHASTLTLDGFREAFETSFLSLVGVVQAALPHVRAAEAGRVVIVSSYAVKQPVPGLALSNSVRPGIAGYAKSLVHELGAGTVTVNVVAPGLTLTPALEEYAPEVIDEMERDIPLGRAAQPIEIGDAIAFLASARAGFITGTVLQVDGGSVRSLL
jgi:3-oxoacyl-[acyl-carrier protein] reductase